MKARTRYQIAFFALGWLIALGVLFQLGVGRVFSGFFATVSDRVTSLAQSFSNAEGDAMRSVRKSSRSATATPCSS